MEVELRELSHGSKLIKNVQFNDEVEIEVLERVRDYGLAEIDFKTLFDSEEKREWGDDLRISIFRDSGGENYESNSFAKLSEHWIAKEIKSKLKNSKYSGNDFLFWVDVSGYNDSFLEHLSLIFGLHPLTIEDIRKNEDREKCEIFDEYLFISIETLLPTREDGPESEYESETVYLIVSRNFVLSLRHQSFEKIDLIWNRLARLEQSDMNSGWIFYLILDYIIEIYLPVVSTLELDCRAIDDLVMVFTEKEKNDMMRRIGISRKRVLSLQKLIAPKIEIFKSIRARSVRFGQGLYPKEVQVYIEDVYNHVISVDHTLNSVAETISRAHGNYLSHIGFELTNNAHNMGFTAQRFTCVACIFLPPNLIAATWGVNVRVPGELGTWMYHIYTFWILVGLMVFMMLLMYVIARRWKIL